ncbi:hypothetical protein GRI40_12440 [Altererythrobacter aerius]|uniref:DUF2231 domain-containing protein n=1 Tax=Tsuneonella aeria TaxID=1837929 RepID=A0A6I4TIZ3_9SPHN|nr:DUF2231 domain-containing protein [Tsuneonella aeria]MXO76025.1 hypothetical protein [Tsuneonella aeria]
MPDHGVRAAPLAGPLHAILLAFPVALYPATLLADIAYLNTEVIQWTNFAQWLNAGADFSAGLLLAWAAISFFVGRGRHHRGRSLTYLIVVALMFVLGLINAFQHSGDAWSSVGTLGLVLSIACAVLAIIAAFLAHSSTTHRGVRA